MKLQLKIATGSNLEVEILPEDTFASLITRTLEESGISLNLTHFRLPEKKITLRDNVSYYFTGKVPDISVSSYFPGQLCRLCAEHRTDMTFIFDNIQLKQAINTWLPTHVSKKDLLPKQVCGECIEKLETCKAFQISCVKAEVTLKKYIEREKFCLKKDVDACSTSEDQGKVFDCGFVYGSKKLEPVPREETTPPPMVMNYCCPACHQGNVRGVKEIDVVTSDDESEIVDEFDGSVASHDEVSDLEDVDDDNIIEDDMSDCTRDESELRENVVKAEMSFANSVEAEAPESKVVSTRPNRSKRKPNRLLSDIDHGESDSEIVNVNKVIKMEKESADSDGFKCNICDGYTVSLEQLLQHSFETHIENSLFPCPLCPLAFHDGPLELISHFSSEHNSEATKELFVCKTCYVLFSSKVLLQNHDCKVSKSSLVCKECGLEFKTKIRFEFHKQFHVEGSKPLHCEPCELSFENEDDFYRHFRKLHKDQETKCLDCNKNFVNYSSLVVHRRFHNNIRKYKCGTCSKSFLDKQTLTEHMVAHMQLTPYQCHICHKYLARNSRLKTHLLTHELTSSKPQKAYDCAVCHRVFPSQNKCLKHLNGDHENATDTVSFEMIYVDKVYRCECCNSNFTTTDGLRTHRETHSGVKKFQCDMCESAFESFARLTTHKMKHGAFKTQKPVVEKGGEADEFTVPLFYVCDTEGCDKMYVQWSYLGIHKRMCHSEVQFMYHCKQCPESFPTSWAVAYHRKTVHGSNSAPLRDGKPHCCQLCTRSFSSARGLEKHQAANHQEETYQCATCSREFNKQTSLEKHMLVHQEEKTCVCDVCGKRFFHQSSLYKHLKIHLDLTSYLCNVCEKRFNDSTSLNEHMRLHTGEKPFKCDVCMKNFRTRGVWLQHVRIHSNQRPYPCDICGVSFRRSWALKNHQLLHTGEKRFQCTSCPLAFRLKQELQRHSGKEHPYE